MAFPFRDEGGGMRDEEAILRRKREEKRGKESIHYPPSTIHAVPAKCAAFARAL